MEFLYEVIGNVIVPTQVKGRYRVNGTYNSQPTCQRGLTDYWHWWDSGTGRWMLSKSLGGSTYVFRQVTPSANPIGEYEPSSADCEGHPFLQLFYSPGVCFFDRGDPSSYDWRQTDLTADGYFHDLDAHLIVPAGAKAILFRAVVTCSTSYRQFTMRKKGNVNSWNASTIWTQVSGRQNAADMIVACSAQRIVEYSLTAATWSSIYLTVAGWWR